MVERQLCDGSSTTFLFFCFMFLSSISGNGVVAGAVNGRSFLGGGLWPGWNATTGVAIAVTAMAGLALAATIVYSHRGSFKSPWFRRRRKNALSPRLWNDLFTADGRLQDGVKFLKRVRSGGIEPSIRAEVWPFLLGLYDINTTKAERNAINKQKRKEYENLRRECRRFLKQSDESYGKSVELGNDQNTESPSSECVESLSEGGTPEGEDSEQSVDGKALNSKSHFEDKEDEDSSGLTHVDSSMAEEEDKSGLTHNDASMVETTSSCSESSVNKFESPSKPTEASSPKWSKVDSLHEKTSKIHTLEDIATWQRIIRLDAVRANDEWVIYSPTQASVPEALAFRSAQDVGLKDYDHLEPCRIYHAARLVAILEAYAVYDPEIGYCQGMSDLLAPIVAVMEEDHEAFWCFVGFMKKARHNFRLDEVGIRRQLNIVSKIIKSKDAHLFHHLERLEAADCFFVYRMVVVMFRRELTFEQTLCLWEVMWADQAAIRAGIEKSSWNRTRQQAPPTEDLLLYAIAACVLQRRKLILEKYSSMDEILRECNNMAGRLDVWKLLDDAHDLVVTLHDKI